MTIAMQLLNHCRTIDDLRPRLHALCLGFGTIVRLDILMASRVGKRQALCFIRMQTPQQEEALMQELGVGRFGGDLVMIVDLQDLDTPRGALIEDESTGPPTRAFQPTLPLASIAAPAPAKRATAVSSGDELRWAGQN